MGADRAAVVVALQAALLHAARDFGDVPAFRAQAERILAGAAALDYALMLARGAAGTGIAERDAARGIRDGLARGVDDLIVAANAIASAGTPDATAFAHEAAKTLRAALQVDDLRTEARAFALIALANA